MKLERHSQRRVDLSALHQLSELDRRQLADAGRNALGAVDLAALRTACEREGMVWMYEALHDAEDPDRTWDAWWLGWSTDGRFLADCGMIYIGGTAEYSGVGMTQSCLHAESRDPAVAEFVAALREFHPH